MLDDAFVSELPVDALEASLIVLRRYIKWSNEQQKNRTESEVYIAAVEYLQLLKLIAERSKEVPSIPKVTFDGSQVQNFDAIRNALEAFQQSVLLARTKRMTAQAQERAVNRFGPLVVGEDVVGFRFSDASLAGIQSRIDELRKLITQSEGVTPEHRRRLLRRLEQLQLELHKSMSDMDRFLGFVAEVGPVIREFGENAKPVVERIQEIAGIIRDAATTPMAALMEPAVRTLTSKGQRLLGAPEDEDISAASANEAGRR